MSALFLMLNGLSAQSQPAPQFYDLDVTAGAPMLNGDLVPNVQSVGQLRATANGAPAAQNSKGAGYTFKWSTVKVMRRATSTSGTWATYDKADILFPPRAADLDGDDLSDIEITIPQSGYYQIFLKLDATWWLGTAEDRGSGTAPETSFFVNVPLGVSLETVSFGGNNHTVYRDTGAQDAYAAPHWDKSRAEPSSPVCYTRNSPIKAGATFSIAQTTANETVKIKGVATTYVFPVQEVAVQGGLATYTEAQANNALPNSIRSGGAFGITWSFSNDDGATWQLAGADAAAATSTNSLYATLGNPAAPKLFHTLLHIGCGQNNGATVEVTVAANIWAEFSDRSVRRVNWPVQNPGPPIMTYWGGGNARATVTALLLADDNGQCGSWGHFFYDTLKAQGISPTFLYLYPVYQNEIPLLRDPAKPRRVERRGLMLVKKWLFNTPSGPAKPDYATQRMFTHNEDDVVSVDGAPGQGNDNPISDFNNHFIVKYGGKYYDPSYGGNAYSPSDTDVGKAAWEDASIDGFGEYFALRDNTGNIKLNDKGQPVGEWMYKTNASGSTEVEIIFSTTPATP